MYWLILAVLTLFFGKKLIERQKSLMMIVLIVLVMGVVLASPVYYESPSMFWLRHVVKRDQQGKLVKYSYGAFCWEWDENCFSVFNGKSKEHDSFKFVGDNGTIMQCRVKCAYSVSRPEIWYAPVERRGLLGGLLSDGFRDHFALAIQIPGRVRPTSTDPSLREIQEGLFATAVEEAVNDLISEDGLQVEVSVRCGLVG